MVRAMHRRSLTTVVTAVVLCWAHPAFGDGYPPRPGERHPDFTLPNIEDGAAISLAQYRGRKLLLIQFASW